MSADTGVQLLYLVATGLFILSLRWLSDPVTARRGVRSGAVAMGLAVAGTLVGVTATGGAHHLWILGAFIAGAVVGYPLAQVPLTAVPQRTALSHAFGGLAAGLVGTAKAVISILNAFAGLSAVAMGFVLDNKLLITAGALDGSSGLILSLIMCKAMNRSFTKVVFGAPSEPSRSSRCSGTGRTRTQTCR